MPLVFLAILGSDKIIIIVLSLISAGALILLLQVLMTVLYFKCWNNKYEKLRDAKLAVDATKIQSV